MRSMFLSSGVMYVQLRILPVLFLLLPDPFILRQVFIIKPHKRIIFPCFLYTCIRSLYALSFISYLLKICFITFSVLTKILCSRQDN